MTCFREVSYIGDPGCDIPGIEADPFFVVSLELQGGRFSGYGSERLILVVPARIRKAADEFLIILTGVIVMLQIFKTAGQEIELSMKPLIDTHHFFMKADRFEMVSLLHFPECHEKPVQVSMLQFLSFLFLSFFLIKRNSPEKA